MLGRGDAFGVAHSSRLLMGEDYRMAKKFNNAARQAYQSMQGSGSKKTTSKIKKHMQIGGSSEQPKSTRKSSGVFILPQRESFCM